MKKLFIKQAVFKITDHYDIYDENDEVVYHVDQDFRLIGNTVHVFDTNDREIFVIDREIFTLFPKFIIHFYDERENISIQSKFSLFHRQMEIDPEHMGLSLQGDFWDHQFSIFQEDTLIAEIKKIFFTFGDTFEITVYDEDKQDLCVAIMIAVDHIQDCQQNSNH